ncbi:MAG: alpha/beta hydrolase [Microbacterium sp.]|uniref:alpha/beta hydrolase family protein n=1 Tax=Microbacterium sp. TaxID=51671 RepID=UPI000DB870E6|nr:alpha/beta hydrolase [Microbacterium sp.]PZU37235.1 MAG: alpha/beta hydrolase [Microbacterium sp.]
MHVLERPAPDPDRVLRYADGTTGVVDVYDPPGVARGLALLLHGGFWRAAYDRRHLRPLAAALAGDGWQVALPEYRRVGDDGGGWPGTMTDAAHIVRDVPALVGACAPERVVVVGHSAGGHLALLAAVENARLAGAVSLAGVLDLTSAHAAGLSRGAVADLFGTTNPTPHLLASADPLRATLPACALALLHGDRDAEVPIDYSRVYAMRAARIDLRVIEDADHYDLIDPLEAAYSQLLLVLNGMVEAAETET